VISEPELVGEGKPFSDAEIPGPRGVAAETIEGAETVADGDAVRPRRARPAWVWALGSALVASAVWAGGLGLYAYETREPDLGGYRTSSDLCRATGLKALSGALGEVQSREPTMRKHEALDMASCWATLGPSTPVAEGEGYEDMPPSVYFTYTLHKKTDPGPEFDALVDARWLFGDIKIKKERVEGLGDRAYFVQDEDVVDSPSLHVLDGQAVLTLDAEPGGSGEVTSDDPPDDLSGIKSAMIEDMRVLMAELKS
jgi:hypothetical protein